MPSAISISADNRALGPTSAAMTLDDGLGQPRALTLDDPRLDDSSYEHEVTIGKHSDVLDRLSIYLTGLSVPRFRVADSSRRRSDDGSGR